MVKTYKRWLIRKEKRAEASQFVSEYRKNNNLTQRQFGDIIGMSPMSVSLVERMHPEASMNMLTAVLSLKADQDNEMVQP